MVSVKTLGLLSWYLRSLYERKWEKDDLKTPQQTYAEQLVRQFGVEGGKSVPLSVGESLHGFDMEGVPGVWPLRELVGSLMWPST